MEVKEMFEICLDEDEVKETIFNYLKNRTDFDLKYLNHMKRNHWEIEQNGREFIIVVDGVIGD